jgi:hypothetical protein
MKALNMLNMLNVLIEHLAPFMACCCSPDSSRGPAPSTILMIIDTPQYGGASARIWVVTCIYAIQGGFLSSSGKLFS